MIKISGVLAVVQVSPDPFRKGSAGVASRLGRSHKARGFLPPPRPRPLQARSPAESSGRAGGHHNGAAPRPVPNERRREQRAAQGSSGDRPAAGGAVARPGGGGGRQFRERGVGNPAAGRSSPYLRPTPDGGWCPARLGPGAGRPGAAPGPPKGP